MKTNLFTQNIAEIQVRYSNPVHPFDRRKIDCSKSCADLLREIWNDELCFTETMYLILLNRSNHVLGFKEISRGGFHGCIADLKVIFSIALKCAASSIILAHNHPSGNRQPSKADCALTRQIIEAGKILELHLLDHLILTEDSYLSFADEGLM